MKGQKYKKIFSIIVVAGLGFFCLSSAINAWRLRAEITALTENNESVRHQLEESAGLLADAENMLAEDTKELSQEAQDKRIENLYMKGELQALKNAESGYLQAIEARERQYEDLVKAYSNNIEGNEETLAYFRFLSGDYSQVSKADMDTKIFMEYMGREPHVWESEWIMMDFSGDGVKELFILTGKREEGQGHSVLLHYEAGEIFCWDWDSIDNTEGLEPLRNGQLLHWAPDSGAPMGDSENYVVYELTEDGKFEAQETYWILTVDEWNLQFHMEERYEHGDYFDGLPLITECGTYYMRPEDGRGFGNYVFLNPQERKRLEEILSLQLADDEWQSLSEPDMPEHSAAETSGAAGGNIPEDTTTNFIVSEIFEEKDDSKDVKITYPQMKAGSTEASVKINELIKEAAFKEYDRLYALDGITFEQTFELENQAGDVLSIVFYGDFYVAGAAYPMATCHAVTINIKDAEILTLSDFIDSYDYIKNKIANNEYEVLAGGFKMFESNFILNELSDYFEENIITENAERFYISKSGKVCIIEDVPHMGGDYSVVSV